MNYSKATPIDLIDEAIKQLLRACKAYDAGDSVKELLCAQKATEALQAYQARTVEAYIDYLNATHSD